MIRANVSEVKAHLSEYLRKVKEGERLVICERNVPVYEVRVIAEADLGPRPLGFARDLIAARPDWEAPMTEEELADWERNRLVAEGDGV
jgi:prevent-host-death family protein